MLKWIRNQMQQEEGLTLIELIVVVAIIAILAFTVTPRVLDALNNSKLNGARSVANEIHSALERYYANEGVTGSETYPRIPTGGALTDNFGDLRGVLADTLGLTTNTDNVFTAGTFDYIPYSADPAANAGRIAAGAATRAVTYCIDFTARDRDTTDFQITPEGVNEAPTAACP